MCYLQTQTRATCLLVMLLLCRSACFPDLPLHACCVPAVVAFAAAHCVCFLVAAVAAAATNVPRSTSTAHS